jgi:CxxC motif-containing protein
MSDQERYEPGGGYRAHASGSGGGEAAEPGDGQQAGDGNPAGGSPAGQPGGGQQAGDGPDREMVCISCPVGCRLGLHIHGDDEVTVTGNRCSRGEVYAKEEFLAPKRIVTATARTESERHPRLPVRTDAALPKEYISALLREVYELEVSVPIRRGQVIIPDIRGTGINLTASMSIRE